MASRSRRVAFEFCFQRGRGRVSRRPELWPAPRTVFRGVVSGRAALDLALAEELGVCGRVTGPDKLGRDKSAKFSQANLIFDKSSAGLGHFNFSPSMARTTVRVMT